MLWSLLRLKTITKQTNLSEVIEVGLAMAGVTEVAASLESNSSSVTSAGGMVVVFLRGVRRGFIGDDWEPESYSKGSWATSSAPVWIVGCVTL